MSFRYSSKMLRTGAILLPLLLLLSNAAFGQTIVPVQLALRDERMVPIVNTTLTGILSKTVFKKKFLSSKREDSEVSFQCTSDARGICAFEAPLKAPRSYANDSDAVSGVIRSVQSERTELIAIDLPVHRPVSYVKGPRPVETIFLTQARGAFVVSKLTSILSPSEAAAQITTKPSGGKTLLSTYPFALTEDKGWGSSTTSYLQNFVDTKNNTQAHRIVVSLSVTGSLHLADKLNSYIGDLAAAQRVREAELKLADGRTKKTSRGPPQDRRRQGCQNGLRNSRD